MQILMCRPEFFGIEYEINPWMHVEIVVDHERAMQQWEALHRTYTDLGLDVILVDPHQGLPDMVFTANAGVLWNGHAVLARFRYSQRQGEEPYFREALERNGITVHTIGEIPFEGAGDALFVGERLFMGAGFRTERESHALVGTLLGVETISLDLVDPRFYHLDTCFCPLNDSTVMFAPEAFSDASAKLVRALVPHVIEVPADVAAGFACNAIPIGNQVISSVAAEQLQKPLQEAGFEIVGLPMTEFMKSGGGVRCLSLPLDVGDAG